MTSPTYNSDGEAVWKPQPGQFFPGGLRYVQSYGGIVSALQDIQSNSSNSVKNYPNNFAGIISAIEDLSEIMQGQGLPELGTPPPGWEIIDNGDGSFDGIWQIKPIDGTLWFDERQGRLFIALDGEFYQTNGADGLASVGPEAPKNPPVIGSTWLDTDTGIFYVYIGNGTWQGVVSDGEITVQSSTLGLSATPTITGNYQPQTLPALPSNENLQVQQDLNNWLLSSLVTLDEAINQNVGPVIVSETEPTQDLVNGQLWYKDTTGTLYVYSGQWIIISTVPAVGDAAPVSQSTLNQEISNLNSDISELQSLIDQIENTDGAAIDALETQVENLETTVSEIVIPDISNLATSSELETLAQQVNALPTQSVDLTPYATKFALMETETDLTALIDAKSDLRMSDITPLIPDVSNKVEQSDIDASIAAVTSGFLSNNGGTVNGSFVVNKSDISVPAFDVSSNWWNSKDLFKLQSYSPDNALSTFGATDEWYQYAWKYGSNEEYAWVHDTNGKVFSISKDGPACKQLFIGSFEANTTDGRSMHPSTREVGAELDRIDQELTSLKNNLYAAVDISTDYDSLKTALLLALCQPH